MPSSTLATAAEVALPPRRAWRLAALGAAVSAALSWWAAARFGVAVVLPSATWLVAGLLVVPCAFTVGLGAVAAVLSLLLSALALPAWSRGRPTGLRQVLAPAWALAFAVVPGFWRALRRSGRPVLWGAVTGHLLAVAALLLARSPGP